jgi:hypothetical protein
MIFQIFSPKNLAKKLAVLTQNKGKFKKLIITLVFEKNANFFAENWQKSQKIVIITSTPDWPNFSPLGDYLLRPVILKITGIAFIFGLLLVRSGYAFNFDKKCIGLYCGRFFLKLIWSPCSQAPTSS